MQHLLLVLIAPVLVGLSFMQAQTINPRQVFSVTGSRVMGLHAVEPDKLQVSVENWREPDNPGHPFTREYDVIEWDGAVEASRRPISGREAQRKNGDGQIPAESAQLKVAVSPTTGRGTVVTSNRTDYVDFSGDAEIRQYIAHASTDTPAGAVPIVVTDVAVDQGKVYVLYPVLYPNDRTTLIARFEPANTGWTFKVFRLKLPPTIIYPMLIAASGDTVFIAGEANNIAVYGGVK